MPTGIIFVAFSQRLLIKGSLLIRGSFYLPIIKLIVVSFIFLMMLFAALLWFISVGNKYTQMWNKVKPASIISVSSEWINYPCVFGMLLYTKCLDKNAWTNRSLNTVRMQISTLVWPDDMKSGAVCNDWRVRRITHHKCTINKQKIMKYSKSDTQFFSAILLYLIMWSLLILAKNSNRILP